MSSLDSVIRSVRPLLIQLCSEAGVCMRHYDMTEVFERLVDISACLHLPFADLMKTKVGIITSCTAMDRELQDPGGDMETRFHRLPSPHLVPGDTKPSDDLALFLSRLDSLQSKMDLYMYRELGLFYKHDEIILSFYHVLGTVTHMVSRFPNTTSHVVFLRPVPVSVATINDLASSIATLGVLALQLRRVFGLPLPPGNKHHRHPDDGYESVLTHSENRWQNFLQDVQAYNEGMRTNLSSAEYIQMLHRNGDPWRPDGVMRVMEPVFRLRRERERIEVDRSQQGRELHEETRNHLMALRQEEERALNMLQLHRHEEEEEARCLQQVQALREEQRELLLPREIVNEIIALNDQEELELNLLEAHEQAEEEALNDLIASEERDDSLSKSV